MDDDPAKIFFGMLIVIAVILIVMSIMQANHDMELKNGKKLLEYKHELETEKP